MIIPEETTRLKRPGARGWNDLPIPVALAICILAILAIATLVGKIHSGGQIVAVPTPALPIILIATQPAIVPPTAVPIQLAAVLPNTLRRAVVAYDSPNGSVIGAIEQGRAYSVLARYGSDWLQADVTDSGIVWLRSADVLDLPAGLADLQPTEAPQVIYQVVNQPAEAASVPQEAQPADAPVVWATSGPIHKEDFKEPDPNARCAFVGCLR